MASRETTFAALVNLKDGLDTFLMAHASDLQALSADPDYVREELVDVLGSLFSDELEFVAERYEQQPLAKPSASDVYGVRGVA